LAAMVKLPERATRAKVSMERKRSIAIVHSNATMTFAFIGFYERMSKC
jgi:hypothetical protein